MLKNSKNNELNEYNVAKKIKLNRIMKNKNMEKKQDKFIEIQKDNKNKLKYSAIDEDAKIAKIADAEEFGC